MNQNYFQEQSNLTAAKIKIYEEYLKAYLPKILMSWRKCFIADLFCGPGKNGKEKGSPLALLETSQYILSSSTLNKKDPQIHVLFNDQDKKNIENLNKELEGFIDESVNIFPPQNKTFQEILPKILDSFKHERLPKFFFLDPFTYSDINMKDLKSLIDLDNVEVLLFIPIFHSYRFASDTKMNQDHKTRIFLEKFTTNGIYDYKGNNKGIDEFLASVKEKLKSDLEIEFVRPILLDDGCRKNCLILLTKNQIGMLEMNKIALKMSDTGKGIDIKTHGMLSLFGTEGTSEFEKFTSILEQKLKTEKEMKNTEITHFTIAEGWRPKDAVKILKRLKKEGKIQVLDLFRNEISQFYVAEKSDLKAIVKYNTSI